MNGFVPLLKLQLLSRFADLKPSAIKQNLSAKRFKTIGMIAAYVFLFAWLAFVMIYIQNALVDAMIAIGMPDLILSLAVTGAAISTLILGFFFIMSSLYFSKDSAFLATLPIKSHTLLTARLTQVWLGELGFASIIILPALILYGIKTGQSAAFYLRAIPEWLLSPLLPMAIVTLVSTLLIRLSALWKHRERIAMVGGILFFIVYMYFCMNMGGFMTNVVEGDGMTNLVSQYQPLIERMTSVFPPVVWAARALQGDYVSMLLYIAVSIGAMAIVIYFMGFHYQKLSLTQSESSAVVMHKKLRGDIYRRSTQLVACCKQEWQRIIRTPTYAMNSLPSTIMPVLMIVVMGVSVNSSSGGEVDFYAMIGELPGALILAILCAIMSFMGGLNPACSSAVTREGKGHEFIVALPIPQKTSVLAKLLVTYALSIVGTLAGSVAIVIMMPPFAVYAVAAFVISSLFSFITCALSLANDVVRPSLNWQSETEAIKQKLNSMIGMLLGFGLLALLAVMSYFMIDAGASAVVYGAAMLGILLAGSIVSMIVLNRAAEKHYW